MRLDANMRPKLQNNDTNSGIKNRRLLGCEDKGNKTYGQEYIKKIKQHRIRKR